MKPIYPNLLDGLPPPDAHTNVYYEQFQHQVPCILNMVMVDHTPASLDLLTSSTTLDSTAHRSNAWRALNSNLDPRGISMI
jgi:hypothetical protein